MAYITGTTGADTITRFTLSSGVTGGFPTDGDDTILGLDGADYISSRTGDDLVDGGDGDDSLVCNDYADSYGPGVGDATLIGGLGNDRITAAKLGANLLLGGDGDDWLFDFDRMDISTGDDTLDGGAGDDLLIAEADRTGINLLTGGVGRDVFDPRAAYGDYDALDRLIWIVTDFAAGAGGDVLDIGSWVPLLTSYERDNPFGSGHLRFRQDGANVLLEFDRDGGGDAFVPLLRLSDVQASALTRDNLLPGFALDGSPPPGQGIMGTSGDDTVTASFASAGVTGGLAGPGNDTILGLGGADVLRGDIGNDALDGGAGNDPDLAGGWGHDTILGGDGNDTLAGETGQDSLVGGAGADVLGGGAGDDTLDAGAGANTLTGGAGNDLYRIHSADEVVVEAASGGHDEMIAGFSLSLGLYIEDLTLTGTALNGIGNAQNNTLTGNGYGNTLAGLLGNDSLVGLNGNDTLDGGGGKDALDGGLGADSLVGGAGNDVFIVNSTLDRVVELAEGGVDRVVSTVSLNLYAEVENLTLAGTLAINANGNTLPNAMTGNEAANRLAGGLGDDSLAGLAGIDTLLGSGGNDRLDGGIGADSMAGGLGNDTFLVDNAGDIVTEAAGAGLDTVLASVSHTLAANVEALTLTGAALIGTGNAPNNTLTGNGYGNTLAGLLGNDSLFGLNGNDTLDGGGGNDTLDGGLGADSLVGGAGNDVFLVNSTLDRVVELAAGGVDRVISTTSLNLAAEVENLTLAGTAALNANGNALGNAMTGNVARNLLNGGVGNDTLDGADGNDMLLGSGGHDNLVGGTGDDTLVGGLGIDTLVGGDGADHFRFGAPNLGYDRIADFTSGALELDDVIEVSRAGFGNVLALGALDPAQFSTGFASGSAPQFVYVAATGALRWDADGAGGAASVTIAVLAGAPALGAADIVVIA